MTFDLVLEQKKARLKHHEERLAFGLFRISHLENEIASIEKTMTGLKDDGMFPFYRKLLSLKRQEIEILRLENSAEQVFIDYHQDQINEIISGNTIFYFTTDL